MSSASSDTGMSPSSSSPPQNVLAVECRWYTLLCLASSLLPWTSILTFSRRKHSTGLTLPSISCTHFHCWTVSVLPSYPLFFCCFVLFLSYCSEKLSSLKVCRHACDMLVIVFVSLLFLLMQSKGTYQIWEVMSNEAFRCSRVILEKQVHQVETSEYYPNELSNCCTFTELC